MFGPGGMQHQRRSGAAALLLSARQHLRRHALRLGVAQSAPSWCLLDPCIRSTLGTIVGACGVPGKKDVRRAARALVPKVAEGLAGGAQASPLLLLLQRQRQAQTF
eukprot:scaffold18468_cov14-Tisochrysis_lutea.AAC.1